MEQAAYQEMERLQDHHWWFRARRRILADRIARMGLPPDARILEVGAGPGGNLGMLQAFGRVSAMEMDGEARAAAQRRHPDMSIEFGKLPEELPFLGTKFDLIAMFDVIEHIEDDVGAMKRLTEIVPEGGRLLLTAPANPWMWGPFDQRLHHYRRYTRGRLLEVLAKSGWTVRWASFYNFLLFPPAALARFRDRVAPSPKPPDMGMPPKPLGMALEAVFSSERYWLRSFGFPFGVSLIVEAVAGPAAADGAGRG